MSEEKVFTVKEECKSCQGTGLYQGMGEGPGFAVVCSTCKGTGCHEFVHKYRDFTSRKKREGVLRVLRTNPGICVGVAKNLTVTSFGGLSYEDWESGKPFCPGTEMRNFTCPAWWYQGADYDKKPKWDKCLGGGTFSSCEYFCNKDACWREWDREHPKDKG